MSRPTRANGRRETAPRRFLRVARHDLVVGLGLCVFVTLVLIGALAPVLIDFDPRATNLAASLEPPGHGTLLGRDQLGRDVFIRLLIGTQSSLLNGLGALLIAVLVGVPLGLLAGYLRGLLDEIVMWVAEVLLALPGVMLALFIIAILGPGQRNVVVAVGISAVPVFIRLARGSALSIREMEYVSASVVVGSRTPRVLLRHVLPGTIPEITVTAVLSLGTMIISIAGLGFLGFGGDTSVPEWGAMLRAGLDHMRAAPWLVLAPAAAIVTAVLSLNLLGDGLSDAIDPRSAQ